MSHTEDFSSHLLDFFKVPTSQGNLLRIFTKMDWFVRGYWLLFLFCVFETNAANWAIRLSHEVFCANAALWAIGLSHEVFCAFGWGTHTYTFDWIILTSLFVQSFKSS